MTESTPRQELAALLLAEPVGDWIRRRRPTKSFRLIARELREATAGKVDVTEVTVRAWAELEPAGVVPTDFPAAGHTPAPRPRRRSA